MISQNYLFHFIWGVSNGEDLKIYKMVKILTNHTILEPGGHEIPWVRILYMVNEQLILKSKSSWVRHLCILPPITSIEILNYKNFICIKLQESCKQACQHQTTIFAVVIFFLPNLRDIKFFIQMLLICFNTWVAVKFKDYKI